MPDTSTHSDAMKEKRRLFACNYVCLGSVRDRIWQSSYRQPILWQSEQHDP